MNMLRKNSEMDTNCSKFIVENKSNLPDYIIFNAISEICKLGKISTTNKTKHYCFHTTLTVDNKKLGISCILNKKSQRFIAEIV
jgi:predicted ATPase